MEGVEGSKIAPSYQINLDSSLIPSSYHNFSVLFQRRKKATKLFYLFDSINLPVPCCHLLTRATKNMWNLFTTKIISFYFLAFFAHNGNKDVLQVSNFNSQPANWRTLPYEIIMAWGVPLTTVSHNWITAAPSKAYFMTFSMVDQN
jgi:hypothetical protein